TMTTTVRAVVQALIPRCRLGRRPRSRASRRRLAPGARPQGPLDLVEVFPTRERACEPPQLAGGDNLLDELRAACLGFSIDRLGRLDDEPGGLMRGECQPLRQQCGVEPDGIGWRRSLTVLPS